MTREGQILQNLEKPPAGPDHELGRDCPVSCLGLSERSLKALLAYPVTLRGRTVSTIGDVLDLREQGRLSRIRGFGAVRQRLVEEALDRLGLTAATGPGDHHSGRSTTTQAVLAIVAELRQFGDVLAREIDEHRSRATRAALRGDRVNEAHFSGVADGKQEALKGIRRIEKTARLRHGLANGGAP